MKVIWQIAFLSCDIPFENIKHFKILDRTLVINQIVYDKANTKKRLNSVSRLFQKEKRNHITCIVSRHG